MTREEIIALATQAGWQMPIEWDLEDGFSVRLERFANLVAAAEREECAYLAEMCDDVSIAQFIRARGNDEPA